ncbi:MAG TPA: hypothetical protein VMW27_04895, partial [Thermoanaerobaculia bacterium]|nr:hypothetical protein [Thermoanaerobaculia bacterium]
LESARPLKSRVRGDLLIKRTSYDEARPFAVIDGVHGSAPNTWLFSERPSPSLNAVPMAATRHE